MKKLFLSVSILISISLLPIHSFAASFDCAKASSTTEKLICGDESLSKLDEQLSSSYKQTLELAADKEVFKKTQIEWLKQQRVCKNVACLKAVYAARIDVLGKSAMPIAENQQALPKSKYKFTSGANGSQLQLCKDYLALINRVPRNPEPNCGMDFTFDDIAKKQGFKEIPWVELNPKNYMEIIKNSFVYSSFDPDEEAVARYEIKFSRLSDPTKIRLWTSNFDLNLDGKYDKVYKIKYRNCDSTARVLIVRDDGVLDNMAGRRQTSGEPFFYQGRAYIQELGVTEGFGSESYLFTTQTCNISSTD